MLQLKSTVNQDVQCASFTIFDSTGDFDVTLNPGGWGTPNPEIADVTSASLEILIFGFNDGNPSVIDITADFADLFTVNGLVITATDALGLPTFPDGWYEINYKVTALGVDYNFVNENAFFCTIQCCVRKLSNRLEVPVKDYRRTDEVTQASMIFDGLQAAVCCGNKNGFQKKLTELQKICEGCGVSGITTLSTFPTGNATSGGCCG